MLDDLCNWFVEFRVLGDDPPHSFDPLEDYVPLGSRSLEALVLVNTRSMHLLAEAGPIAEAMAERSPLRADLLAAAADGNGGRSGAP